jgi:hypothetical protein
VWSAPRTKPNEWKVKSRALIVSISFCAKDLTKKRNLMRLMRLHWQQTMRLQGEMEANKSNVKKLIPLGYNDFFSSSSWSCVC